MVSKVCIASSIHLLVFSNRSNYLCHFFLGDGRTKLEIYMKCSYITPGSNESREATTLVFGRFSKINISEYIFFREYTEEPVSDWTIDYLNHFLIIPGPEV